MEIDHYEIRCKETLLSFKCRLSQQFCYEPSSGEFLWIDVRPRTNQLDFCGLRPQT